MKPRRVTVALCIWLALAAPAQAGKLDLNIHANLKVPNSVPTDLRASGGRWTPGDPRNLRDQPVWVVHLSHAGYAGFAVGGLIASVATGGVAPAIGFGIVALYHLWAEWRSTRRTVP